MSPYTRKAMFHIRNKLATVVGLHITACGDEEKVEHAIDVEDELLKMIREAIENKPTH